MSDVTALKFKLPDEKATFLLGKALSEFLQVGDVLLLRGDLGAGKTTLSKSIIQNWSGSAVEVPSPTFTLVQHYEASRGSLHHYDLYRLESVHEIEEIGWHDSLGRALSLVEWPERLQQLTPPNAFVLSFFFDENDKTARNCILQGNSQRISGFSAPEAVKIIG